MDRVTGYYHYYYYYYFYYYYYYYYYYSPVLPPVAGLGRDPNVVPLPVWCRRLWLARVLDFPTRLL